MIKISLRLPLELHRKLRWLAFKENRSQHSIIIEILMKALSDVKIPKEIDNE